MYRCFLVRPEHAGFGGSRPVVCTVPPTRQAFAAQLGGAGGTMPLRNIGAVLTSHFAGAAPDWAAAPGGDPRAAGVLPGAAELVEAAEALEQTPECARLAWGGGDGKPFVPSEWAWQVAAHQRGDPTAKAMPDEVYAAPLLYAPAAGRTPREAVELLARRHYPTAWVPVAASMADAVDSGRLTDLTAGL